MLTIQSGEDSQSVTEPKASVSPVTTISMSSLVLFLREVLREVPGWLLWVGVFLPVTLLLIQIMVYLNWKLKEGNLTALCFVCHNSKQINDF
uniref:Uncharacterized protein n=1 Tax=Salmo trutta TaxID=8032 RepID=A0A674A5Y8_SALTR